MKRARHQMLLLAFLSFLPLCAQARPKLELGVKGALNISNPVFNRFDEINSRSLPGAGFFFRFNSGHFTSFQLEVLWVRKGAVASSTEGIYTWPELEYVDVVTTYTYRLDYIEIPLTARIHPVTFGRFRPYLFGGQALSFRTKAERDYSAVAVDGPAVFSASETQNLKSRISIVDFGLVLGSGVDIALGRGSFLIEGRVTYGVHNLETDHTWYLWRDSNTKIDSRVFSVMIGYAFPIGGNKSDESPEQESPDRAPWLQ